MESWADRRMLKTNKVAIPITFHFKDLGSTKKGFGKSSLPSLKVISIPREQGYRVHSPPRSANAAPLVASARSQVASARWHLRRADACGDRRVQTQREGVLHPSGLGTLPWLSQILV